MVVRSIVVALMAAATPGGSQRLLRQPLRGVSEVWYPVRVVAMRGVQQMVWSVSGRPPLLIRPIPAAGRRPAECSR